MVGKSRKQKKNQQLHRADSDPKVNRNREVESVNARSEKATKKQEPAAEKCALVIGGGIAGIQAALDLANARVRVKLVEKSPSLGGRMAQLDKTFPTMDCSI
jgi:heterodisulfide reductase subunit A-like polyferredoxin